MTNVQEEQVTRQQQEVLDAFGKRGFVLFEPGGARESMRDNMGPLGGLVLQLSDKLGIDIDLAARALKNDTTLPCGFSMLVHTRVSVNGRNAGIPSEMSARDEPVTIALFVIKTMSPLEFEVQIAEHALIFIDTLIETHGNITQAVEATQKAGEAWAEDMQRQACEPRNEQERLVIEEFAKHGYRPVLLSNGARAFMLEFDGGWHAITVPSEVGNDGNLPQTMGEPISAALHMHALGRNFVVDAKNSLVAIEAAKNSIKLFAELQADAKDGMSDEQIYDRAQLVENEIEREFSGNPIDVTLN